MRRRGYLVAAAIGAVLAAATASAATGDSVRGSGTFVVNYASSIYDGAWAGYQAKVAADATSDATGSNASGKLSIQLAKRGAPGKTFQVAVNCMYIEDASTPTWTSSNAVIGGTIRKDRDGYQYGMFHVLTNADGGGVDQASVAAYPVLSANVSNACDQALYGTGEAGSYNAMTKGAFSVVNN
jgi:hypothetical protein